MKYISLNFFDLLMASGLVFFAGLLSVFYQLRLAKRLFLAAFRTIIQLSLLGLILDWVFSQNIYFAVMLIFFFMILVAGL